MRTVEQKIGTLHFSSAKNQSNVIHIYVVATTQLPTSLFLLSISLCLCARLGVLGLGSNKQKPPRLRSLYRKLGGCLWKRLCLGNNIFWKKQRKSHDMHLAIYIIDLSSKMFLSMGSFALRYQLIKIQIRSRIQLSKK